MKFNGTLAVPLLPSAPAAPQAGQVYFDDPTDTLFWYDGAKWVPSKSRMPAGGTIGQVLSKIDGTDYNTQWVDQTGGAAAAILVGRWTLGSYGTAIPGNGALAIAVGAAGTGNTTGWVADATGVTVPDTGWYQINVSGQVNNGATAGGGFLMPTYNGAASGEQQGGYWVANGVERFSEAQTIYLAAGTKV